MKKERKRRNKNKKRRRKKAKPNSISMTSSGHKVTENQRTSPNGS